jgi:hypothetical protein
MDKVIKIKDILRVTATILNKPNVASYVENSSNVSGDCVEQTKALLSVTELVLSELCSDKLPVHRTDSGRNAVGKTSYTSLVSVPIKILSVKGIGGVPIEFEQFPDYFYTYQPVYSITYNYIPSKLSVDQSITFSNQKITPTAIAYGVAAEYLLTLADFDGAVAWHEKFIKAIKQCLKVTNVTMSERSWV